VSRRKLSANQLGLFDWSAPLLVPVAAPVDSLPVDEEVRRAARELAGDLVLRAGAGTGKTHTLVQAVTHLVAGTSRLGRRVAPANILLLTFSEKAAGELRDRVRARFLELAARPREDAALEAAYRRQDCIPLSADAWRAAALAAGAAPITTFHGFAAALLRRHAASSGLDPAFSILDEDEATVLLRARAEEAILAALDERPEEIAPLVLDLDFARPPWSRGRALVEHVIAVAERLREEGRGPRDVVREIDDPSEAARLFADGAMAHARAFDELLAAYGGKLADGARARRDALAALRPTVAGALAASDAAIDAAELEPLRRLAETAAGHLGKAERNAARDRMREAEALLRSAHVSRRAAPLALGFLALVERAGAAYQSAKERLAALDFADLVARARDLLATDGAARAAEAERYEAILVDELQDSNPLQDSLISLLRRPGAPLLAVGDPKQSIYEFRGADVAVFTRVAGRIAAAGGQTLALTESRRGLAPLTAFVNRLFARLMTGGPHDFQIAFDPGADALHAHRGDPDDGAPCVEILDGFEPEREAAALARRVRALVDAGTRYGDIAILLRRFTHLERFLRELRAARVPHYVVNGRGFYEAQEVRDLIHALSLIDDDGDAVATLGVLRSPLVGLSDPSLFELAKACGGKLRLSPLRLPGWEPPTTLPDGERARLVEFLALFGRLAAHADRLGAAGLLRALVDDTDLAAVLATTHHGEQRIANLERLIGLAAEHDASGRGDRATLARRLRARMARPRSLAAPAQIVGERDDVVRVMTVHQAKGLEFPVVFVPDCGAVERELPEAVLYDRDAGLGLRLRTSAGDRVASPRAERALALRRARGAAEATRIFYVAVTRARDRLVLSGAATPNGIAPSWRREVDAALAADPELRALARVVTVDTAVPLQLPDGDRHGPAGGDQ
jgi:ATP-dependent exoDNAse (exonuclease V) beta subunit